jgi:hypothetical protein
MPAENGVGRDDGGNMTKATTARHVPAQDAVFFDQVGHGVLLPPVEPADQGAEQRAE